MSEPLTSPPQKPSLAARLKAWLFDLWLAFLDIFVPRWKRVDTWIDKSFQDPSTADAALARGFKTDATAIEEMPVPMPVHIVLYLVLGLIVIFFVWAMLGSIDRIVVASGKISTRTPLIVMQPFSTSRIAQIRVKAGDHVRKGQVLITFDPSFAKADVATQSQKSDTLTAEAERLEAEMAGGQTFVCTAGNPAECATQSQILAQEIASYRAEMAQRDSRVAAANAAYGAARANVDGLIKQLEMSRKVVDIYKGLVEQKAGAPLDVMKAESSAIQVELQLKNAVSDVRKYAEQRTEIEAERRSFIDKWRSDHNQQLVQARKDLSEAHETLNKANRMEDFTALKSPEDAVVLELADLSVGSVLREAETLITLVPDSAELYVEAKVKTRDISYLKVGNAVRVKLESYPFQRFGTLNGRLDVISPDSVPLKQSDEKSELVYLAQVRLNDSPQELVRRHLILRPGLVATAEIKTGKRSIISYVLNPILRTSDESMREP